MPLARMVEKIKVPFSRLITVLLIRNYLLDA